MTVKKRVLLGLALFLLGALLVVWIIQFALPTRQKLRAKVTTTRMRMLTGVLLAEQAERFDEATMRQMLRKYNRSECLKDGWGRLFLIERQNGPGDETRYLIVSLGRDGRRGSCCEKWVHDDWDADAVLLGEEWLQVW
jgi:hypothetical protein